MIRIVVIIILRLDAVCDIRARYWGVIAAVRRVCVPVTAAAPHSVVLHHPPTANAFFNRSPAISWSSSVSTAQCLVPRYSYFLVLENISYSL